MALKSFTANSGTDQLTATAHGFSTLDQVRVFPVDSATLPAPLVENTPYWIVKVDANTVKLAVSAQAALYGVSVDLSSNGTATCALERALG